ncbi:unnamed protein product [Trichogramma brassicae]|uniref:Reverse transcriptase zinc-binding domain-containing protein n=1 Tax=Trichogramma brassicae TaxID=86971 RepID=A0A6H5HYB5_9HYME|nr:unnamed protein product [Trichogramma brassicae]
MLYALQSLRICTMRLRYSWRNFKVVTLMLTFWPWIKNTFSSRKKGLCSRLVKLSFKSTCTEYEEDKLYAKSRNTKTVNNFYGGSSLPMSWQRFFLFKSFYFEIENRKRENSYSVTIASMVKKRFFLRKKVPGTQRFRAKAAGVIGALAEIMPNSGGPRSSRRKLYAHVVDSILLYGAPVWSTAALKRAFMKQAESAHRRVCLRVIGGRPHVAYEATYVLAGIPPLALLADERARLYGRRREDAKDEERLATLSKWQEAWDRSKKARWTHRLIPNIRVWIERSHGELNYHLTQLLTGHGFFKHHSRRYDHNQSAQCPVCPSSIENAEHVFYHCPRFSEERERDYTPCSTSSRACCFVYVCACVCVFVPSSSGASSFAFVCAAARGAVCDLTKSRCNGHSKRSNSPEALKKSEKIRELSESSRMRALFDATSHAASAPLRHRLGNSATTFGPLVRRSKKFYRFATSARRSGQHDGCSSPLLGTLQEAYKYGPPQRQESVSILSRTKTESESMSGAKIGTTWKITTGLMYLYSFGSSSSSFIPPTISSGIPASTLNQNIGKYNVGTFLNKLK